MEVSYFMHEGEHGLSDYFITTRFVYEKHNVTVYTRKNENSAIDWYAFLCAYMSLF